MTQCIILTGGVVTMPSQVRIQRSLGPYRISSALEDAGYTTFVLDYIIHFSVEEIKQVLSQHLGPDTLWVGFSSTFFYESSDGAKTKRDRMYYTEVSTIEQILEYIRSNSPAKIVYGGAGAPFHLDDEAIDYYVTGYADVSTVALTNYLMHNDIKYLVQYDTVKIGNEQRIMLDSNKYPEPKMDSITTRWWSKHYNVLPGEGLPVELARGCIFRCKFCSYPLLGKKKGTYLRDPSAIKDELLEMYETHGTESYYFTDDTFNDDNDKIEALHKVFTDLPFRPKFAAYLRIDLINKYPHQADLLTEMGLIGTYFGLETLQSDSARAIGKGLHPTKVKDRLYWLRDRWHNKANMAAGFILGLPYDNLKYFKELIDWCRTSDNPLQFIDFYPLHLFKRTGTNREKLSAYTSEFSLNPEIYGYEFPGEDNLRNWSLPENNLTYDHCGQIAAWYRKLVQSRNKYGEFQMITALNTGISQQDLYDLTIPEISRKYPIEQMNNDRLNHYKKIVGVRGLD